MRCIGDVLKQDVATLKTALALGSDEARIEVQCLLQHTLNVQRPYLLAHPEQVLNENQQADFDLMLRRRLQGEPIAYLLGKREFFGLDFKVTPATLIPRPETELLVESVLHRVARGTRCRILDMGTGSGAIAIAIAHALPEVEVVAVDASEAALQVARDNARQLATHNVTFLQSDWYSALDNQRFDLIVSNPPYIAADDVHLMQGDVRFEPMTALASGADGLDDIRRIINQAPEHLAANGWLMLEHGYDQAGSVRALLQKNRFDAVFSEKDIAGIERVSAGRMSL